ncbi:MAG: hypothetical protein AMXMBFR23_04340 [Chloroflexota bacterium]
MAFETNCYVCGGAVDDPGLLSECFGCNRWFHLRRRMDQPGTDCGDAVIGESLGAETYCNPCLEKAERDAAASMTREDRALAMARFMAGDQAPRPAVDVPPPPPAGPRRFRRVEDAG